MDRTCSECGKSLKFKRADAVVCSTRCRVRAHRRPSLPEAMTSRKRWMRRAEDKRPLALDGSNGSSTKPWRWCSYAEAVRSNVGAGLGYALGDGIGCYDLDDCFEGGTLKAWARSILDSVESPLFVEVSQSGQGLHIFVMTDEKRGSVKRLPDHRVEFYPDGRYIAVTGKAFK